MTGSPITFEHNKKNKCYNFLFLCGNVCVCYGGVTLCGRTVYKKERERGREKKVIINHIYDAMREPAFERMDDR